MTQGKAMPQFAHGIYQPRNVERWILRSKTGEMRDKDYVTKPAHYNDKLFKLIPLYEVIPDD